MANTIKLKYSDTASAVPSSLAAGELAINRADKILFYTDSANAVQSKSLIATAWGSITGTPTTLAGYGITNAVPNTLTVAGFPLSSNVTLNPNMAGTGLSGSNYDGSASVTWSINQAFTPTWTGLHTHSANGISSTVTDRVLLTNNTAATVGVQQYSPALHFTGQGWKTTATAASQSVDFRQYLVPVQGAANPTGYLAFDASINGGTYASQMVLTSDGLLGLGVTSPSVSDKISIVGNNSGRVSIVSQNTNSAGNTSFYFQNNRGSFASYGGLFHGGSTYATTFFGLIGADKTMLITDGANSLGLLIGSYGVSAPIVFGTNNTERARFIGGGQFGLGVTAPTALCHIKAGTATASTAPLKLTAGTNLTTPEAGAFEFDGTNLFFTIGSTRKTVTLV